MPFKFQPKYFITTVVLFVVEVLIALYMHDAIIRPYFGDVLVVILIYAFIKSFIDFPYLQLSISVLLFSYLIEILQHFNLVKHLGLEQYAVARIVLGTSFQWMDFVAYTIGILIVIGVEKGGESA